MRRLNALIAAAIIASTLFINVHKADKAEVPPDPPEDLPPITPAYEVPSVYAGMQKALEVRGQARIAEVKRQLLEETRAKAVRERRAAEEHERKAKLAREELRKQAVSRGSGYVGQAQSFTATAYTAYCDGCSGITKTGHNLRKSIYHEGRRVIAVDPRYIPLGSIVRVTLADGTSFEATAQDVGGLIKGAIIDVAHESKQEAYVFGRQSVELRMIRRGDGK